MYGAILGDMVGSPYEFNGNGKTKHFPLFIMASRFTDDSVMTVAVAEALMDTLGRHIKSKGSFELRKVKLISIKAGIQRSCHSSMGSKEYIFILLYLI